MHSPLDPARWSDADGDGIDDQVDDACPYGFRQLQPLIELVAQIPMAMVTPMLILLGIPRWS